MEYNTDAVNKVWDCVVIGGGIAGLTAAIVLAHAGKSVVVIEKAKKLGGRGSTIEKEGALLNLGPHALYSKGKAITILNELGVLLEGDIVPIKGKIIDENNSYDIPGNPLKLLTSPLLSWEGKKELIRFFINYMKINTDSIQDISLGKWLNHNVKNKEAQKMVLMLIRLATYCNDIDKISAGAALRQLQLGDPIYLHYGWQSMINKVRDQAIGLGVTLIKKCSVKKIVGANPKIRIVTNDDITFHTKNVVSTASPGELASMIQENESILDLKFLKDLIPVRVACMDIVLKRVPRPKVSFALSLEQPFYFSNHSRVATLSHSNNYEVVHVMKYLSSSENEREDLIGIELSTFMEKVQPGWQEFVAFKRYLPRMTVSHCLIEAKNNGVLGRPHPAIPQVPGLYIAGDWVGTDGMLVDASVQSAKTAADRIIKNSE